MNTPIFYARGLFDVPFRKAAFLPELNKLLQHLKPGTRPATDDSISRFFGSGGVMVLAIENEADLVGVATLIPVRLLNRTCGRIEQVVVDPIHQGKGIGRAMLEFLIKDARVRSYMRLDLTSDPSRESANALYRKLGFKLRDTNCYRLEFPT